MVLMVIVSYCGTIRPEILRDSNKCRSERIKCIQIAAQQNPKSDKAVEFIDNCLTDPTAYQEKKK
jgi:hypothetical protein